MKSCLPYLQNVRRIVESSTVTLKILKEILYQTYVMMFVLSFVFLPCFFFPSVTFWLLFLVLHVGALCLQHPDLKRQTKPQQIIFCCSELKLIAGGGLNEFRCVLPENVLFNPLLNKRITSQIQT